MELWPYGTQFLFAHFHLDCTGKLFRPLGTDQEGFPLYELQLNATVTAHIVCLSFSPVPDSPAPVFSDRMVCTGFTGLDMTVGDELRAQW